MNSNRITVYYRLPPNEFTDDLSVDIEAGMLHDLIKDKAVERRADGQYEFTAFGQEMIRLADSD